MVSVIISFPLTGAAPVAVEGSMLMVAGLVVLTGWLLEDRLREIPPPSAWVSRALLG